MTEQEKAMWAAVFGVEYVRQRSELGDVPETVSCVVAADAADRAIRAAREAEEHDRFTHGVPA